MTAEKQVALVTGAACCRRLSESGFRVAVRRFMLRQKSGRIVDISSVVDFLATRGSYVHGSVLHVDGGLYGG